MRMRMYTYTHVRSACIDARTLACGALRAGLCVTLTPSVQGRPGGAQHLPAAYPALHGQAPSKPPAGIKEGIKTEANTGQVAARPWRSRSALPDP